MRHTYIIVMTSALLTASSVWAQDSSAEKRSRCVAVPVFHCVQHLADRSAIGHFGYDLQCPEDVGDDAEVYIDISENNQFSPGRIDRGQPKTFVSGKHVDEFEVDFSEEEVNAGTVVNWSVLGQTAMVDFSKTKDESVDCSFMSQ